MAQRSLNPAWFPKIEQAIELYTIKKGKDDCWDWEGPGGIGGPYVSLRITTGRDSSAKFTWIKIPVHRYLSGAIHKRKRTHVFRTCGNPHCVNPAHMSLHRPGNRRKIYREDVALMCLMNRKGRSVRDIARCFRISVATVQRYLKGMEAPEKANAKGKKKKPGSATARGPSAVGDGQAQQRRLRLLPSDGDDAPRASSEGGDDSRGDPSGPVADHDA